jgi:WD40 repeat protein/serine/threonine protein kinase
MTASQPNNEAIFHAARDFPDPDRRREYVRKACGGDEARIAHVEALLEAADAPDSLLDRPAGNPAVVTINLPTAEGPGTVIGPYKLLEQIGEGGFGIVFMAEQQQPVRRKIALKVIKPGMDTKQVIARFEAERQALALMDHPHIAHVLDAGTTDAGRPYFVMELIRGIPITQFCDDNRLTARERLALFLTVCQAVQHAHQKGIIHRDLKPSNVLITLLDGAPVVKVIDFGIAKALGQERLTENTFVTGFAQMIGTPLYMSPEQAERSGQDVDTRTDIYSLGVLLYEMLTGTTPFDKQRLKEASYDEIRRIIREEEPAKPSTRISILGQAATTVSANRKSEPRRLSQLLRGELDWIVMKCLEKDRSRRYQTASGLARDPKRYLHDEPVEACPPSVGYRLGKFARKYRVLLTAAATIALLLLVGVVVSAWQAARATDAERVATRQGEEARKAEAKAKDEAARARIAEAGALRLSYIGSMGLVQAAWEDHNNLRVRDLLAQTADYPERGFEWYYWQRMCHVEHLTLAGHKGGVTALAFALDGQQIVTAVTDGTARVWDATSGHELVCLRGHREEVTSVAYSPDGKWLVTGSTDDTARLWDPAGGRELRKLESEHSGPVWAVAVTPDSKRVVTGSEDCVARVWDAATGRILFTLQGDSVLCLSTAALLSWPQAQGPLLVLPTFLSRRTGHMGPVRSLAVRGDSKWLVTGSDDGTAKIWNAADGRLLKTVFHGLYVSAVAVTRDGKKVLTGSLGGTAKIWDLESGRVLPIPRGHGDLLSLALTPDGQQLLTGYIGGMANLRDMTSGREIMILNGHARWVSCVAVSPDGQRLATGSLDGTARVWDVASGAASARRSSGRGTRTLEVHNVYYPIAVTLDGQRLVARSSDGRFSLWGTVSGRKLQSLKGQTDDVWDAAITPDGQRIVTANGEEIAVWDAGSGAKLRYFKGQIGSIWSLTLTPDGQRIVIRGGDGTARVWDVQSGRELLCLKGLIGPGSVAVSADGRRIVAGGQEGTVKVWDATRGQELLTFQGPTGLDCSVAITPDGRRIVAGSWDGTARVWDGGSGQERLRLQGHIEPGQSVAVTPDGRRLITGSGDGTVGVWDAVTGRELLTLKGHTGPVRSVAVTSDGRRLISGSDDGTVKIWEAATPEEVALWDRQEQEAARQQAFWQRPVAGAPGFIQDWLVLAPLELAPGERGDKGLQREQIPGEAKLQPRAGDRVRVVAWSGDQTTRREYTWQEHREQEPVLDFNRFVGKLSTNRAGYGVCYVISAAERNDLLLQVGSDDQAKVYLNGTEVYKYLQGRTWCPWIRSDRSPCTKGPTY